MIFHLSFFIFSLFLTYTDCKQYIIPNLIIFTLFLFLIIFGFLENQLNLYSIIISFSILFFFIFFILLFPKVILGGGDIKYIIAIGLYLEPLSFPYFLIFSGIFQTIFLFYYKSIKKRRVAPMAAPIFFSVIFTKFIYS
ncbi:prepilin peptidase [Campylobacterota bacterium DY0563]